MPLGKKYLRPFINALNKHYDIPASFIVYGCHKKNDSVCVGWLMDQKSRNFPCLNLRILMMKHKTTARWLETLTSPSAMYKSVKEMVKAQKYKNV